MYALEAEPVVTALALPDDERAALMEALSDSFEPEHVELSPAWKVEIESRIAQIERGEVETVPWEEVEAKIRRASVDAGARLLDRAHEVGSAASVPQKRGQ